MPGELDLIGQKIADTYHRVVQVADNKLYDGDGNILLDLSSLSNGGPTNSSEKFNEDLSGIKNQTNLIFTTSSNFISNSTRIYRDGLRLRPGINNDYVEMGSNQIIMTSPPHEDDSLSIDYKLMSGTTNDKFNEDLSGIKDESNLIFTTLNNFVSGTTKVYRDGLRLRPGINNDYVEWGANEIKMNAAPFEDDTLTIDYEYI